MKILKLLLSGGILLTALQSCQSPEDRASDHDTDSLSMEDSLRTDSAMTVNEDASAPNNITNQSEIDDDETAFMKAAATGSVMEIEAGKLAQKNASSQQVKDFGALMVKDHTKASKELEVLANNVKIVLPNIIQPEDKKHLDHLSTLKGAEFDKQYMKMMVDDHAKTVQLFQSRTTSRNRDVAQYAAKTLPVLENHHKLAKEIKL